ncbi:M91 family zinc metallopeptidase [Mucilaginibacter flavidus]|uniref:M91 family zinc metallopeptidase n=1 Tax=Mucilaginibacter flavidus TaxID=2949309 RepID=UPI002111BC12|nr:M91 family zinc metallopeptidase [Mucilaginibacter flavidus]
MGPKDIILSGSDEFKAKAFEALQMLSSTKLELRSDGQVKIAENGVSNTNEKPIGTELVTSLIKSDKVVTITETSGGNSTSANNETDANKTATGNGPGTGSTVEYNPDGKGSTIVNADGSTGRPAQIGLAHELAHAERNKDGSRDMAIDQNKTDPDSGQKGVLTKNEILVRQKDSQIRKEQGVVERAQPN